MTDDLNRAEGLTNDSAAPTGAAEFSGVAAGSEAAEAVSEGAGVLASSAVDEQLAAATEAPAGVETSHMIGEQVNTESAAVAQTPSPQRGRGLAIGAVVAAVLLVAALGIGYFVMGGQQAVVPAQGVSSSTASSAVSSQVAAASSAASSASAASSSSASASSSSSSAASISSASSASSSSQTTSSSAAAAGSSSSVHESSDQGSAGSSEPAPQKTHGEQPDEEIVEVVEYIEEEPGIEPAQEQAAPAESEASPVPAAPADPEPTPESEPINQNMQVAVTINSDAADGQVSVATTVELPEGATVYDALAAAGVSVTTKNTSMGLYVVGINGLNEKDYGGASGWTYYVNGGFPLVSAADYVLSNGDTVDWVYVS